MKVRPVEFSLIDKVGSKARGHLDQVWTKALTRVENDPDGAVTAARSFLEATTCKHVLDATSVSYGSNLDLLQLFRRVSEELKLSVTGDMGRIEKQFYSGAYNVVQSLTELRNQVGDAHGKGQLETKPERTGRTRSQSGRRRGSVPAPEVGQPSGRHSAPNI